MIGFNNRSFSFSNGYNTTYSWINLTPRLGFPFGNSWTGGPLVGFRYYKEEVVGSSTIMTKSHSFQAGGFIRKSHSFSNRIGIFAEAEASYGIGRTIYSNSLAGINTQSSSQFRQLSILMRPGLYFQPGKRWMIEASIGQVGFFQNTTIGANGYRSTTQFFNASIKNNLGFGLQFIIK